MNLAKGLFSKKCMCFIWNETVMVLASSEASISSAFNNNNNDNIYWGDFFTYSDLQKGSHNLQINKYLNLKNKKLWITW